MDKKYFHDLAKKASMALHQLVIEKVWSTIWAWDNLFDFLNYLRILHFLGFFSAKGIFSQEVAYMLIDFFHVLFEFLQEAFELYCLLLVYAFLIRLSFRLPFFISSYLRIFLTKFGSTFS